MGGDSHASAIAHVWREIWIISSFGEVFKMVVKSYVKIPKKKN